jgi:hypothetical protein
MAPFDASPFMYYSLLHEVNQNLRSSPETEASKRQKMSYDPTLALSQLGDDGVRSFFTKLHSYLFEPSRAYLSMFLSKLRLIDSDTISETVLRRPILCLHTDSPFQMYVGTVSELFVDIVGDYVLESVPFVCMHNGIDISCYDLCTRDVLITASQLSTWASQEPLKRFLRGDKYDEYRLLVAAVVAGLVNKHTDFIYALLNSQYRNKDWLFVSVGLGYSLYKTKIVQSKSQKIPLLCLPYSSSINDLLRYVACEL